MRIGYLLPSYARITLTAVIRNSDATTINNNRLNSPHSGELPAALLGVMESLETLDLSHNAIRGTLLLPEPEDAGGKKGYLGGRHGTSNAKRQNDDDAGERGSILDGLKRLRNLRLHHNKLSGSVFHSITLASSFSILVNAFDQQNELVWQTPSKVPIAMHVPRRRVAVAQLPRGNLALGGDFIFATLPESLRHFQQPPHDEQQCRW